MGIRIEGGEGSLGRNIGHFNRRRSFVLRQQTASVSNSDLTVLSSCNNYILSSKRTEISACTSSAKRRSALRPFLVAQNYGKKFPCNYTSCFAISVSTHPTIERTSLPPPSPSPHTSISSPRSSSDHHPPRLLTHSPPHPAHPPHNRVRDLVRSMAAVKHVEANQVSCEHDTNYLDCDCNRLANGLA